MKPIIVKYQSPREEEVMKWADENIAPRVTLEVDTIWRDHSGSGARPQTRPLPGPIEALRAWCLTNGILEKFWQAM